MKRLSNLMLSVVLLSSVSLAAALQPKPVQANLHVKADREPAPTLSLADASGSMRHLSDYRGKPVVVNLWATECGGCKAELPSFVQLSQRYKGRVTVVGVSL